MIYPQTFVSCHVANWHPNVLGAVELDGCCSVRPMWSATATAPSLGIYVSKSRKDCFTRVLFEVIGGRKKRCEWCIFMKSKGILGLNLGMFKRKALQNWMQLKGDFSTGFWPLWLWLWRAVGSRGSVDVHTAKVDFPSKTRSCKEKTKNCCFPVMIIWVVVSKNFYFHPYTPTFGRFPFSSLPGSE